MDRRQPPATAIAPRLRGSSLMRAAWLACGLFAIYLTCGLSLGRTGAFRHYDVLFNADVPRVIADLAAFDLRHSNTSRHPVFLLLFNPLTSLAARLVGPVAAAVTMNAAAGAIAGGLTVRLLEGAGLPPLRAWAFALLLGLSATQLVFATVPETFGFSALGLMVLALVLQRTRRFGAVAVAAGLATGVTIVNVVAAMLWYGAWLEKRNVTQRLRAAIALAAVVGVGLAVLAVPQRLIYRGAGLFFVPGSFMTDSLPHRLEELPRRFAEVVTYLSVANVVAPRLAISPPSREWPPVVTFVPPGWHWFGPVGWLAVGLWLVLAGTLAAGVGREALRRHRATLVGFALWLGFNLVLFTLHGDDVFLYSGQWTFATVALVGVLASEIPRSARLVDALLALLLAAVAANNLAVVARLIAAYA